MYGYTTPKLSVAFGTAHHSFSLDSLPVYRQISALEYMTYEPFNIFVQKLSLKGLINLHQVHGTQGLIIESLAQVHALSPFVIEADYVVTNISEIGLAIATADCASLVMYDPVNHALAAVHAGWRGATKGVALKALETMQSKFNTTTDKVHVFIGPAARSCCYAVGQELYDTIVKYPYGSQTVIFRDNSLFFDLVLFNKLQLLTAGVQPEYIKDSHACCTICNTTFCSYRRDQGAAHRQLTIGVLRSLN